MDYCVKSWFGGPILRASHDPCMSTCRHLIYHGDDLCNNPSVMKLVTQTAICYWFHANAFDSWWRLALVLNGAVSWWVDSFVVIACTLVQTDNVNNPVRAADDIYWALLFIPCYKTCYVWIHCFARFYFKDFLSHALLLQETSGGLLFSTTHIDSLYQCFVSNFTVCPKLLVLSNRYCDALARLHTCQNEFGPSNTMRWQREREKETGFGWVMGQGGLGCGRSMCLSPTPSCKGLSRCKETWNPPHTSHKSCTGWGV